MSGATDVGFFCECFFPHPVHPDTLPLMEQKMREIVKEERPIRVLEMVPFSAAALLEKEGHHSQSLTVSEIQEKGALVEIVQAGPFHELTEGPLLENTSKLEAFKLLSIRALPDRGLRIEGTAHFSKETLKKFLKDLAAFHEHQYTEIGAKLGFWKNLTDGLVWLKKGLDARERLQNLFFKELPFVECRELTDELLLQFQKNCRSFKRDIGKDLRISQASAWHVIFCLEKEFSKALNSSLHSIYKTLIMLGFDCWIQTPEKGCLSNGIELPQGARLEKVRGLEPRVDLMAEDSLSRPMRIATLRELKGPNEQKKAFLCEAFIERILVLMLEKNLKASFFDET